jgi:DeoR family fructose operon transcriptional repressor
MLSVSEATIRRDLEWLEQEGVVERTHGGAVLSQRVNLEPSYLNRALRYPEEKRRIGVAAAAEVVDGDIVFINSGTTTTQVIHSIRSNADVTIITNNLSAAIEIGEVGYELILVGGAFQPKSNSVAGRFAIENISQIYANKAILGVDGISLKYGLTVPSNSEAEVLRLMVDRTRGPVTIVGDHSKWGVVSNFEIAKIEEINKFITDDSCDPLAQAALAARSVEVVLAGPAPKK